MSNKNLRLIITLGIVAIAGVLIIQIFLLRKAWRLEEQNLNQRLFAALNSTSERVITFNNSSLTSQVNVKQLSPGYFVVNTNSEIDKNVLEYFLKSSFTEFNIKLTYAYSVFNCYTDSMEFGKLVINESEEDISDIKQVFTKTKEFVYYFGIYFPGIQSYLWKQLSVVIFFSLVVVIITVFFGSSIIIILRQKRLSELQREFINTMTHEFKTPISTVNIAADVLANTQIVHTPERLSIYANLIKQENNRLNSQVERVLQLARVEKRNFGLNKEKIHLHELIHNSLASFEMNAEKQNFSLSYNLEATYDEIAADKLHLTNILYNLIDNAVKYRKEELTIVVATRNTNGWLEVSIEDNGIGITKEYQKKVFNLFYRVPTGNLHDVKGFGLGLYYVKAICKKHHWKINLISELGVGSKFVLTIPQN